MNSPESFLAKRIVIAVTGHRDLLPEDTDLLKACLQERLERIPGHKQDKILVTALAPGADQLAADVARQLGIAVFALLPMAEAEYRICSFQNEETAWWKLRNWITTNPYVHFLNQKSFTSLSDQDAIAEREALLEAHAIVLAGWADHLLALWDGNDTGFVGGPSQIVRMARNGQDDKAQPVSRLRDGAYAGRLHHLLTRRKSNPFPIGPQGDATADTARNATTWPFGTLSATDDLWFNKPLGTDGTWQTYLLPRYVPCLSAWLRFMRFLNTYYEPIIRFAVPALLFILTTIVGGIGYLEELPDKKLWFWDVWAKGANLIDPKTALEKYTPNAWIIWGRVLGQLAFLYGVTVNVIFVFGDVGIRWFIRLFWIPKESTNIPKDKPRYGFNLICGLTEASYALFLDLQSRGERVLILDADASNSPFKSDCISRGAIVMAKDPVLERVLKQFFVGQAKRVFVMTASDSNNLRISQQAYKLQDSYPSKNQVNWFVQASDLRIRDLLFESLQAHQYAQVTIHTFDLFTNIARRQLYDYPLDHFHLAPHQLKRSHLVVFGFGPLAQKLVLQALQTGLYDQGRRLFIRIYTPEPELEKKTFLARYPILNDEIIDSRIDPIRIELFSSAVLQAFRLEDVLSFESMDSLFSDLPFGGSLLKRDIADDISTSLYVCQQDGIQSIALLRELLPRMDAELVNSLGQRRDIQAFAFYNFPNQAEERLVEEQLNYDFPNVPITFFGNYREACSESTICRNAIDNLPELIHWHYGKRFDADWTKQPAQQTRQIQELSELKKELRNHWRKTIESNRESSRLAADHLWVKYRLALSHFRTQTSNPYQAQLAMSDWLNRLEAHTQQEISSDQPADMLTSVIPWDDVPPVAELANIEHRRWALERLLAGLQPFLWPADYQDQTRLTQLVERWNRDIPFKKRVQKQKKHLDLVPNSVLNKYVTQDRSFQHQEKYKDIQQVRGISLFFRKLDALEWLSASQTSPSFR